MKRFFAMLALAALLVGALSFMGCAKKDVIEDEFETGGTSQSSVTSIVGSGEGEEELKALESE